MKNALTAVGLEVIPGTVLQTFGIGHIYAGRPGTGLAIMLSYWGLQFVNFLLLGIWIGFITMPLTYFAFLVFAPTNVLGITGSSKY